MEYRIYYEALEQGQFLIRKMIENVSPNSEVRLVKKRQQSYSSKGFKSDYSKLMSKILIRKNPDIIISTIINNTEYPIIVLEFSTAVFTKDHEQQRADNFLLPIHNNVIYIKLSPISKKSKKHGGDIHYNYLEPYSLCLKQYDELAFHFNWETESKNISKVTKDTLYKSIATEYKGLQDLFNIIFNIDFNNEIFRWKKKLREGIRKAPVLLNWIIRLKNETSFENIKDINSTRTKWENYNSEIQKKNVFTLKINRMGHAMDPERGMLIYYSTFFRKGNIFISKMIFSPNSNTWYKDTSTENSIKKFIKDKSEFSKRDLLYLFIKGLNICKSNELLKNYKYIKNNILDITNFISSNYLLFNTSFRAIIDHSDFLLLSDEKKSIFLTWKSSNIQYNLNLLKDNTALKARKNISEDDVTYITVHNVFKTNEIKTISVSYPGAQSDMPILPNKKAGRKQERIYIDVIGEKGDNLLLQENKGEFSVANIKKDIEKLSLLNTDNNYINAVIEFTRKNEIFTKNIILGVGFGESLNMDLSKINLDEVDYFLIIDKKIKNWKIYSNITDDTIFKIKNGKITLPLTYEVPDFNYELELFD